MRKLSLMTVRKRIAVLFLLTVVASVILMTRLAYVQILQNQHYVDLALEQRLRGMPVDPRRGAIYDRNLNELAISVSGDGVYARPAEIPAGERPRIAATLAQMLDLPAADVEEDLAKRQAEVWIKRRVTAEEARSVREADLPGVRIALRTARVYPNGGLAAHVLGITGMDNQGLEGLEIQYDDYLRGVPGKEQTESDARGRQIPQGLRGYVPPQDGHDLILTIDQVIQHIAERELERAVIETRSQFGMILLMQPQTGDVLAMAVAPGFDPNNFGAYPVENRRNRVVTDQFEPGSTFKIITSVAALQEGVTRLDENFFCSGSIEIGGGRVRCWRGGHGSLTFVGAVENSSNPIFAELAGLRLGPERFYPYISGLGFGNRLGIDFPGERTGYVPKPGEIEWGETLQWANIGFGQGVSITPLQMVTAAAAIANDGAVMRPRLVREVGDRHGRVVETMESEVLQQVLSPEVAREFLGVMRNVVQNGSGRNANIPGYRVGGKTGTAQIPEGGVYTDKSIASFVGVAPVDDPQIAGIVMLYDIGVYPQYGGVNAAPVYHRVVEAALDYLGVPRRSDTEGDAEVDAQGRRLLQVPNVRNLPLAQAREILDAAGHPVRLDGSGPYVMEQTPAAGAKVPAGTAVMLSFYDVPPAWHGEATVPDILGKSPREVAELLADVGLHLRINGAGQAVNQNPAAGRRVPRGTPVEVEFVEAGGN